MNKLKSLPSAALLVIVPIFAIFTIINVSNGKEIIADIPPTTTIPSIDCNIIPARGSGLMYNGDILISIYAKNMECELKAAYTHWANNGGRPNTNSGVCYYDCAANNKIYYDKQIEIKEKYRILINNVQKENLINAEKQKQIDQHNKETKMNQTEIVAVCWVTVISMLILCVYSYFKRRHIDDHKFTQAKEDREYNLKVKELELNQTIRLQQAELERYKTLELSKTQIDNEHEVALKKIEFDKAIDARDFMLSVTKDEREYLLKQRELDIKENKSSPSFMDLVDSNKDVQLRLKK